MFNQPISNAVSVAYVPDDVILLNVGLPRLLFSPPSTRPSLPPPLRLPLASKFAISGVENVYSLWALSTIPRGGLDWTTNEIGQVGPRSSFSHMYFEIDITRDLCIVARACLSCHLIALLCPSMTMLFCSTVLYGCHRCLPLLQMLLMSGGTVFVFELLFLPLVLPRLGISLCRRVGSAALVPTFVLLPQLCSLEGIGYPLVVASLAVLFTIYVSCDVVSVEPNWS